MANIVVRDLDSILPLEQRKELLSAIGNAEGESTQELADLLDIDESIVVELMNNDDFYLEVRNYTQARAKLTYHTKGKKTLEHILMYGENKESPGRLKAFDRLERMIGAGQPPIPADLFAFGLEAALGQMAEAKKEKVVKGRDKPLSDEGAKIIDVMKEDLKSSLRGEKLKPRRVRGRMDDIPALEEDVNGNIFEAMGEDDDDVVEDELEHLFRNSRELDLTNE
jgi:hypothetical protein